jgi:hypothetical protein
LIILFAFTRILHGNSQPTRTLTGLAVRMIDDQLLVIVFFSAKTSSSEYKALANASAELTWIQTLLGDLGVQSSRPPVLYCDNIGATYLTSNPIYHARTKHIKIDYHFVRDMVASQALNVQLISGKYQLADILTKPLAAARFIILKTNLNVRLPTTLILRGRIGTNNSSTDDSSKDVELVCDSKDIELDLFYLELVCDSIDIELDKS